MRALWYGLLVMLVSTPAFAHGGHTPMPNETVHTLAHLTAYLLLSGLVVLIGYSALRWLCKFREKL